MKALAKIVDPIHRAPQPEGLIKLAIMAVGGQGGGVLSDWIVSLAEMNGYRVQATSVPGVAQRTGATIYYIEMMPDAGREPVFALMPAPGDLDILIAAELMEAGRAVTRGLVTPDRTTLIASSHRMLAVSEKIVPGDGRARSDIVVQAATKAAARFVCFDMDRIAQDASSHISASLFGALAGSGVLPFPRDSYEETIRASGRGVKASLKGFAAAYDHAADGVAQAGEAVAPDNAGPVRAEPRPAGPTGPAVMTTGWRRLADRVGALPAPVRAIATSGLGKVVDYQDLAYGAEYVSALERSAGMDRQAGGADRGFAFTLALAKHLANAMCYDDVIRVADLKTRRSRFERVFRDVGENADSVVQITEYMHPRAEEICGMMPAGIGRFVQNSPTLLGMLQRLFNRGRHIRTDTLPSFLMLYALGGMRRWRRRLLRHAGEEAHRDAWLDAASRQVGTDYELAVEIVNNRRLIKGYSDTHARGLSKFDQVMEGVGLLEGRADAADWVRRLREIALKDEKGEELAGALDTIRSFAGDRSGGRQRGAGSTPM